MDIPEHIMDTFAWRRTENPTGDISLADHTGIYYQPDPATKVERISFEKWAKIREQQLLKTQNI